MEKNKYRIYKITSEQTDDVYIGKTKKTLEKRLEGHRKNYRRWCNNKDDFVTSFHLLIYDDCKIELIEDNADACRESHWQRKLDCCNRYGNREIKDYIYKCERKELKKGFHYEFKYSEDGKRLIIKRLVDYDKILAFATAWFKENNIEFN